MTDNTFRPPTDWEAVFAADLGTYHFGEEPSQIARSALSFFRGFGGDPAQAVALDLGSGEGRDTTFLAAAGFHVVARDLAPSGIAKTRALLDRNGVAAERVDLQVGDVREFAYPVEAYDLALAANVYQFLPPEDVPRQIERLKDATKPGGICAVGVFSPAMRAWGAQIEDRFAATADELAAFFPDDSWLLLDRTEYWTYRLPYKAMASFTYVVARKHQPET